MMAKYLPAGTPFFLKRHAAWLLPLPLLLGTRLFLVLIAYMASYFPVRPAEGTWYVAGNPLWLDSWARWDSGFYLEIVKEGYRFMATEQTSAAFFPLYPLLVKLLAMLIANELLAAVLVSNLCLYLALVVLYQLMRLESDARSARRVLLYLLCFPTSFYFSAVYTESTFLLFTLLAVFNARKSRWGLAGISGMLAASSRVVGVICLGVIGLEWLRQHGWTLSSCLQARAWHNLFRALKTDFKSLLALLVVPLGLFSYMLFLQRQFADPLAFMTVQAAWERENLGVVAIIMRDLRRFFAGLLQGQFYYQVLLDIPLFFMGLLLSGFIWRRFGAGFALYVLLGLLVPASSASQSLSRYILVLFPVFMLLAESRRRWLHRVLPVAFLLLSALCFGLFVNWYFVA
jgi:hypothetical protein